jgi:1-acyl-sn-glycerol-3-phosphate acyltransferase
MNNRDATVLNGLSWPMAAGRRTGATAHDRRLRYGFGPGLPRPHLLHVVLRRCFRRKVRFLAKEDVTRNPIFRVLVRATESIVVQKARASHSLSAAIRPFEEEEVEREKPILGIFPEGTRSRSGNRLPSLPGAACVARRCNLPLVPVALCGFFEAWRPGHPLPDLRRRRDLAVHFLPPIEAREFPDDQSATDAAINRIHECVLQARSSSPGQPRRATRHADQPGTFARRGVLRSRRDALARGVAVELPPVVRDARRRAEGARGGGPRPRPLLFGGSVGDAGKLRDLGFRLLRGLILEVLETSARTFSRGYLARAFPRRPWSPRTASGGA